MAFWDASAIVPLCCSQPATGHGRKLLRDVGGLILTHSIRESSSKIVVVSHLPHKPRMTSGTGAERDLRPRFVSCRREPEIWASPPAWMSRDQAKGRMGPAFSSYHLLLGGLTG